MGMQEFTECAEQRGGEYSDALAFVAEQLGNDAERFWLDFKEWYESLDDTTKWALDKAIALGTGVSAALLVKGMVAGGAVLLEGIGVVAAGLGLGLLIDLVRECGMRLA